MLSDLGSLIATTPYRNSKSYLVNRELKTRSEHVAPDINTSL